MNIPGNRNYRLEYMSSDGKRRMIRYCASKRQMRYIMDIKPGCTPYQRIKSDWIKLEL